MVGGRDAQKKENTTCANVRRLPIISKGKKGVYDRTKRHTVLHQWGEQSSCEPSHTAWENCGEKKFGGTWGTKRELRTKNTSSGPSTRKEASFVELEAKL